MNHTFVFVSPHAKLFPGPGQWTWREFKNTLMPVLGCPVCGKPLWIEYGSYSISTDGFVGGGKEYVCWNRAGARKGGWCTLRGSFRMLEWQANQPRN